MCEVKTMKSGNMTEKKMESIPNTDDDIEFRRNLSSMRENGTFCDATICIPGESKTLPVHRAIMSSCSDFFRSLFTNGLQETLQRDVKIHGVPIKIMESIINYAYTKQVTLTVENVEDIFAAADRFNILTLLSDCISFLSSEISAENCIGILRFSRFYSCKELSDRCWIFITSHFKEVTLRSQEFVQLEVEELSEIMRDDKLNVQSEDEVFEAAMKWIDFFPRERKQHCMRLIDTIRFPFISEEFFQKKVLNRRDLKRGHCWEKIQLSYNLVKKFRSSKDPTQKSKTKDVAKWIKPRIPNNIIFVIGGWAKDGVTESVETYDRNADQWFEVSKCELPQPRAYHGTVALHDKVYVLGGFNGSHYLNSVVCFDVSSKTWDERAPMYMSRCYVSVTDIEGTIYAVGGFDGRQRHNSAEKYERSKNQWTLVKPMFHQRSDAGVTHYKGKLYVAGGFDGHSCLITAEVYDPAKDQWTIVAPMSVRRSGVCLAVCNDKIYAIGGYDGTCRLNSVEYMDTSRRHWYTAPGMLLGRSNFSSVVMDGNIYVMGGYDGEKTADQTEYFSHEHKQWYAVNDMKIGRSAVSACAVSDINNARDFTFHGNETIYKTFDDIQLRASTSVTENTEHARWMSVWREKSAAKALLNEQQP